MKKTIFLVLALLLSVSIFAQNFENSYRDTSQSKKVHPMIKGDFALQLQGLRQSADTTLIPLGTGLNLPTANFVIKAHLAPGIMLHLTTYLSSRHHENTWVKGGYLSMNQLPFLKSDFIKNNLMFRVGMMEINYGDSHFSRSDNGHVIENPFVGNLIMDAFSTDPAFEIYFNHKSGLLFMGAVTTGTLKNQIVSFSTFSNKYTSLNMFQNLAYYFKFGYDKQLTPDFRIRATASAYLQKQNYFGSLYYGDRTGSRYYLVMKQETFSPDDVDQSEGHLSGRWGPGFLNKDNSLMANLLLKYKGLELFETYEMVKGTGLFDHLDKNFSQYATELLYRFGGTEQFYIGGRYNKVFNDADLSVTRIQGSAGWFMTKNILMKLEYVNQKYTNFIADYGANAGFKGIMFEATISF